jgi:ABC-type nickel/cobalt efflux system permease component RcnA
MSPDTWSTIGTILALIIVGAYNGWRTYRAEREAREARREAASAAEKSTATNNGLSTYTRCRLERIEGSIEDVRALASKTHDLMTEHLSDHAGSDLSDPRR